MDEEEVLSAKEKKKRDKAAKKAAMSGAGPDVYTDAEEEDGFSFSVLLIVLFIVVMASLISLSRKVLNQ